jgi:phosphoenolpyruvate carboxylase
MPHRNRNAKSARVAVRLSPSFQEEVSQAATEKGYATSSAFIRATVHSALNGRNPLVTAEEKTAAALERIRHDIQRLEKAQQAAFALLDALVKTVLTCIPGPPTEVRRQAVVLAKERYEALLRTAANGMRAESRTTMRGLVDVDGAD